MPPWSQVMSNFGTEPVILGLERCKAFRDAVPPEDRKIAPAGMFSTGTSVLHQHLFENCLPPSRRTSHQARNKFIIWQVPWGKHNPEAARLHHSATGISMQHFNQSASLPIVDVRHPITWIDALCRHPYNLFWPHKAEQCDTTLNLNSKVRAEFGAKRANSSIPTSYDSLAQVWRDWNLDYFEQNSYPLLFVRHEDIVFRPKAVVTKICECVGGHMASEDYSYRQEAANKGTGHGTQRSDLISAFIEYGQPLKHFHELYPNKDLKVIRHVMNGDLGMLEAFGYMVDVALKPSALPEVVEE
jgi:hypothetical protein